jgi:hypothetical protein
MRKGFKRPIGEYHGICSGACNTPTVGKQTHHKISSTANSTVCHTHEVIKFQPPEALSPDSSSRSVILLALHYSCGSASFKIISIIASVGTHLFAAKRHKATSLGVSEISGVIRLSRSPWSSATSVNVSKRATGWEGRLNGRGSLA